MYSIEVSKETVDALYARADRLERQWFAAGLAVDFPDRMLDAVFRFIGRNTLFVCLFMGYPTLPYSQDSSSSDGFYDSTKVLKPGKERWSIKTSVKRGTNLDSGFKTTVATIRQLGTPPNYRLFENALNPYFPNLRKLREGQIVTVDGWIWLVALERSSKTQSDGDYHVQITDTRTSGDRCVIVEVPMGQRDFVADPTLWKRFASVRTKLRSLMPDSREPASSGFVLKPPRLARITGQLFFDSSHAKNPDRRGKMKMKASTAWEIHPVTNLVFLPQSP